MERTIRERSGNLPLGLICGAFCFLSTCVTRLDAQENDRRSLRVLTYNIHHAEGVDGQLDLKRIADVIRQTEADVVSLQEVDRLVPRSGKVDQARKLGEILGMQVVFGRNIDLNGGQYGNAVLSKLPIIRHRNEPLPQLVAGEARGALVVELQWPAAAEPLVLIATHFDHRPDPQERVASAQRINELVAGLKGPVLLAGDLNATVEAEPLQILLKQWKNTATRPLPTIPVAEPSRQIDFVLTRDSEKRAWRVIDIQVLPERVASDHRALLAVLELGQ